MADQQINLDALIEQSQDLSVQVTDGQPEAGGIFTVNWKTQAGAYMPAWWSAKRDKRLRKFWKKSDHLSGAIYAMESKMTAIPRKVIARDPSIEEHVQQAEFLTQVIEKGAQYGEGWEKFFGMFVEDLLTQDNGAFSEIIGAGDKSGPIIGAPLSLAHLDSHRCTRTGNIEYPVVFTDVDNTKYKLHYSRVLFLSQMSSPIKEMYGVGFCAVSRAINISQTMIDILNYKQEKLGSRPMRSLIITKGGLDPADLASAFPLAESAMDNQGLARYSKVVLAGISTLPDAGVEMINLSELPDGFDEETSVTLGMATIALALGVDARELFPAMSSGATRADALIQHIKQRGKGPGQIIQSVEQGLEAKFLPPHLKFEFDFQDDAQDRQKAEIRNLRSEGTERNINTGALNTRVSREQMTISGDLTQTQFERLELQDGRLVNGMSVLTLFYSNDPDYKKYLSMGISDPLNIFAQDPIAMSQVIVEQMQKALKVMANVTDPEERKIAIECVYALAALQRVYADPTPDSIAEAFSAGVESATLGGSGASGADALRTDERTRTLNPGEPNPKEALNSEGRYGLQPSYDDKRPAA
ncbi:MAG: hypothetical protein GQ553_01265 [Nitrosomonadaceae bacterium]|nr:hypothetical protein [Nitrosomonadaceae bacterium]